MDDFLISYYTTIACIACTVLYFFFGKKFVHKVTTPTLKEPWQKTPWKEIKPTYHFKAEDLMEDVSESINSKLIERAQKAMQDKVEAAAVKPIQMSITVANADAFREAKKRVAEFFEREVTRTAKPHKAPDAFRESEEEKEAQKIIDQHMLRPPITRRSPRWR